jgi:hypothetical protein
LEREDPLSRTRATPFNISTPERFQHVGNTLINLVLQIVAGAVCGNGAGTALKDYNLGTLGNTIAGAIGGLGGGQILQALLPALSGAGGVDLGAVVGELVGVGVGGAVLTVIAGLVKNMMAGKAARRAAIAEPRVREGELRP